MGRRIRNSLLAVVAAAVGACSPEERVPGVAPEPPATLETVEESQPAGESWYAPVLPKPWRKFAIPPTATPLPKPDLPYPRDCAPIYDDDKLPTFEIEISDEDWSELKSEHYSRVFRYGTPTYFPITFRHNGTVINDARIKLRGHNSSCGDKMQFAISFNQVNPAGRFQGMRRINLDHGSCHLFEERLAMSFARDLGLPYVCVNHARLVVNGSYYGLFVNLEHQNKDYLKRHFAKHDGNLYKEDDELKTNEKEGNTSDIEVYRSASSLSSIEVLVDVEQAISEWAFEAVILALDNYWLKGYNYMLYSHPERGFLFLPNDLDQAMPLRPGSSGLEGIWPSSLQFPANIVLADETWRRRYEEKVRETARAYDSVEFRRRLDKWWLQVRRDALADPNLGTKAEDRLENLKEAVHERDNALERWR